MPKYVVRHGVMRQLGVFSTRSSDRYARGQQVIARTNRGQEKGEVLCEATPHVQSQMTDPKTGQILRLATHDDDIELGRIQQQANEELEICRTKAAELGLEMDLVDAEHLYGGERVVIYYLAEGRVDFRELVKQLAKDFHTRIEMRQIGVRDEAKLLADYGDCGKPVCCNTHLSEMPPVSMKMAKLQKATLDPTKISGRCGRLKCCLRYEYDTYRDLQKDLPRVGAEIITNNGRAKVLAQEILAGQLLIQTEEGRRMAIDQSEVLSVLTKSPEKKSEKKSEPQATKGEQTEPRQPEAGQSEPAQAPVSPQSEKPASDAESAGKPAAGELSKNQPSMDLPTAENEGSDGTNTSQGSPETDE